MGCGRVSVGELRVDFSPLLLSFLIPSFSVAGGGGDGVGGVSGTGGDGGDAIVNFCNFTSGFIP